jgi:hypothetical protein
MGFDDNLIIGLAIETIGKQPVNGLRHLPTETTTGWYIWCGEEFSQHSDFFKPVCLNHIKSKLPQIIKYLNMKPGTRFIADDNGYEDIWHDPNIVHE